MQSIANLRQVIEDVRTSHATTDEIMPAVYSAVASVIVEHGPTYNYELNHDGTEDPVRSAYVEGQHDAWALFNSLSIDATTTESWADAAQAQKASRL